MEEDKYTQRFIGAIKFASSDEELKTVVNKVYEEGFEDGVNEGDNVENELKNEYTTDELPDKAFTSVDLQIDMLMKHNAEMSDEEARDFMLFMERKGQGQIYTQIDVPSTKGRDVVYIKGICKVNRTGVYALVMKK